MSCATSGIIVIGAGAAGLSAARELALAGKDVFLLEARERIGGRIHTVRNLAGLSLELGAEFIHGRSPEIFQEIVAAGLDVREVSGTQWVQTSQGIEPEPDFFARIRRLLEHLPTAPPDRSFARYLADCYPAEDENRQWGLEYVEGFHGAIAEKISVHSLARAVHAEEAIAGHRSFRLVQGYQSLLQTIRNNISAENLRLKLGTVVTAVHWSGEQVRVEAVSREGPQTYHAAAAIVTLPLGVLQASPGTEGAVCFEPPLQEKVQPMGLLFMGQTIRINLVFRSRWWEQIEHGVRNLGILHSHAEWFPTWWTLHGGTAVLTGWATSRRSERLTGRGDTFMRDRALDSLAALFPVDRRRIAGELLSWHVHDWQSDPYARGSYSYVGVDGEGAQEVLAAPLAEKLFFAGEATVSDGHHATVHGAIASGKRAAKEVLRALA